MAIQEKFGSREMEHAVDVLITKRRTQRMETEAAALLAALLDSKLQKIPMVVGDADIVLLTSLQEELRENARRSFALCISTFIMKMIKQKAFTSESAEIAILILFHTKIIDHAFQQHVPPA